MSQDLPTLDQIRQEIDSIDQQIADLINQRAKCANTVGEVKKASGEKDIIYYRPEREAQVLRRVMQRNEWNRAMLTTALYRSKTPQKGWLRTH